MKIQFIAFTLLLLITTCQNKKSIHESSSKTNFNIVFVDDTLTNKYLSNGLLEGSNCNLRITEINGVDALEISTSSEFSDAFIDLQKLFGYGINFSESRFLMMKILVPKDSWICALKLNFKDSLGNFGGCHEIFNNFYGHYNEWLDVYVDLQEIAPQFQNWVGDGNSMSNTIKLSLNPYCANQALESSIYVSSIQLSDKLPNQIYHEALEAKIDSLPNIPFLFDFDDEEFLFKVMAYRGFESTFQSLQKNIAGNATRALRIKGNKTNKHFVFLPEFDKITGHPVDFTKVDTIFFSYYIPNNTDEFNGTSLFLTTKNWDDILLDTNFVSSFIKGSWQKIKIGVKELNLDRVKGVNPVLSNVYNLRLDINYYPDKRNIEMWIDDFGWK